MKKIILAVTLGLVVGFVWPALGSRNSSGTFTVLNNGTTVVNPVSAGQVITKDLWNGTFADVGTEITDSLSRSGKGGMLAPLVLVDSSGTTLDLTWPALTLTGFYATSGPLVGIQTGGVVRQTWGPTGVIFSGDVNAATLQTPVLYIEDPGAGTNKVTVQAPSGLAASYSVTLPPSHPASTLPVTWTSTGVLAQQQITNSMQNFGTPSADTDVAIKSYADGLVGMRACLAVGASTSSPSDVDVITVALDASSVYEIDVTGFATHSASSSYNYIVDWTYTGSTAPAALQLMLPTGGVLPANTDYTVETGPVATTVATQFAFRGVMLTSTSGDFKLRHRVSNAVGSYTMQPGSCVKIRKVT